MNCLKLVEDGVKRARSSSLVTVLEMDRFGSEFHISNVTLSSLSLCR